MTGGTILTRRAALAGLAIPAAAQAQAPAWPTRPVRILVAWTPGGGVDVPIRLLLPKMQEALGQPVVVENRGGASGSIGAGFVAQQPADGYTVLADAAAHVSNNSLMRLPFDYARAFAPVTQVSVLPHLLVVRPDFPARTLAELIAMAKREPGRLTYASSGIAAGPHLASALLARQAGIEVVHVPYRGSAAAMADVLAGQVSFNFSTIPQASPLVREGRLRALAVSTKERLAALPDVPTVAEQGFPGFELNEWVALWVPSGTPPAIIARLHEAATAALAEEPVQRRYAEIGILPVGSTPEQLAAFAAEQRARLTELIRVENIRLE
jgi:tripartite-type tricarboxylate transporter receptor subunit TctC